MILEDNYPLDVFSLIEDNAGVKLFYLPILSQPQGSDIEVKVVDVMEDLDIKVALALKTEESGSVSRVGYLIRTRERPINFGTGILVVNNSWYTLSKLDRPFNNEDIVLRIKLDGLIAYNVPNKLAIFTTPYLSTKLHEYLTMI